jgi:hypothetical protein
LEKKEGRRAERASHGFLLSFKGKFQTPTSLDPFDKTATEKKKRRREGAIAD